MDLKLEYGIGFFIYENIQKHMYINTLNRAVVAISDLSILLHYVSFSAGHTADLSSAPLNSFKTLYALN